MPTTGDRIKHYEIEKLLGKGGMGEVYLAQDTKLDRKVAIKFLPPELETDELTKTRFIREAKAAAALDHPFICKVYEAGETDGISYIIMEYVEGKNLRERMESKPLALNESLKIALEIAEALEKAHKEGIIHRDLKPPNIMLTPQDHVKVMDFGLAKKIIPSGGNLEQTLTQASITEKGTIAGTLAYMSPEQAKGKNLDGRSDIFSLGIIIYEMFSHKHPFSKTTPIETLSAILRDPPPTPNVRPKTINPVLRPILKNAMAKNPEDRYQNVSELVSDLRKAQRQSHGGTRLPLQGIPLYIASAAIVALLAIGTLLIFKKASGPGNSTPQQVSVILADSHNQTGDPELDGVLDKLFGLTLDDASFISVFDNRQAKKEAKRIDAASEGRIDVEMAKQLCLSLGINEVIASSIETRGNGYLIKLWAVDPTSAKTLAEVDQSIRTKSDILEYYDLMSDKLINDLGVAPPDSVDYLNRETVTTKSFEAFQAYMNAQELDAQGNANEALKEYERALRHDPNLARAYSGMAVIYANRQDYANAEKYYTEATNRIDQLTEREKHRTYGGYFLFKMDYRKAAEEYKALVEKHPEDAAARSMVAFTYFLGHQMQEAYEEGQKSLEMDPHHITTRFNLSWFALCAGDFERAEQEAQLVIQREPNHEEAYVVLALAQLAQERPRDTEDTYRQLDSISDLGASLASAGLADLAAYEGRFNRALTLLDVGITNDVDNNENDKAADKLILKAKILLAQGDKNQAYSTAKYAVDLSNKEGILFTASEIYHQLERKDDARALAAEMDRRVQPECRAYSKMMGGLSSMASGDNRDAINLFTDAIDLVDPWLAHFYLGKAYLEMEAYTEAYREFEKCLNRRGEATSVFLNDLPSYHYFPPVYYYIGRAQEGLNKTDAAKDSYQRFLDINMNGDDADLLVKDARSRLDNL